MVIGATDRLRESWSKLALHPAHAKRFRTLRLTPERALDAHAGLRAVDDAPCLIVDIDDPAPVATAAFEVGGMRLSHARSDAGHMLVLSLEDPSRLDLFITVCGDVLQVTDTAGDRREALRTFLGRLDAWRLFLRERRAGLSRSETVGLIGELTILQSLISRGAGNLDSWRAPFEGLHDFERAGHAIEIKTTLGSATRLRISSLDQLDNAGLRRLNLVHVRLAETPDGRTLGGLIEVVTGMLPADADRRRFDNALLRRGLMPDDTAARALPRVDVQSVSIFSVGPAFPRLLRSQVPSGVTDAEYMLELQALAPHGCDVNGVLDAFTREDVID
ncbi:PD-(D/E)XK motif protein [Rhodospirillaceae bacterium SYSU D60014]|uniref:PD-(D/E)XK motif protein n=1 Tax=Virgifigura deserti TaxID=2268457 RepID=UPI000E67088D